MALYADILPLAIARGKMFGIKGQPVVKSVYIHAPMRYLILYRIIIINIISKCLNIISKRLNIISKCLNIISNGLNIISKGLNIISKGLCFITKRVNVMSK